MSTDPHRPTARRRLVAVALAAGLLVTACTSGGGDDDAKGPVEGKVTTTTTKKPIIDVVPEKGSVLDVLDGLDGVGRFTKIVRSLPEQTFVQDRGITLLVLPDSAISADQAASLSKDANKASAFVSRYLSIGGKRLKEMGAKLPMADGASLKVDAKASTIGGVEVTEADAKATNGYLQVLAKALPAQK